MTTTMTTASPMELLARLDRHATDSPHRPAVREVGSGRTITWRQLADAVRDSSAQIAQRVPAGAVVILRCPNACNFHIAFLGALAAGATVFPIPPDSVEREFTAAADKSSAVATIDERLVIHSLHSSETWVANPCHGVDQGLQSGLLLQSSGTTALPKIVRRDARSLDAVCANMVHAIGITAADHVLSCVPLCHSYGLEHGLLAPVFAGATVHLAQGFDLATVRRELAGSGITVFPAVPSIYEMLGNLPEAQSCFPTLRVAYSAGGPLPASVFEKVRDAYGLRVGQLYGATEIGSVTFAHPAADHFDPASVGQAMNGVELKIDASSQLHVRATSMMSGYVGDDSPLTHDGFFPTGDLARIDALGDLFITGRLKLLIDVGGLKVNPLEVEQTICQHPAVAACVVVPLWLSETVSRLKAIVTLADPASPPTTGDLRRFVRQRLTAHKVPRVFEVRESLPRSATGKILRHLLVKTT
ncbi:MAG: class I adenylate-forming enzyme family protein [Tepidisphaeraceae bacterium]